MVDLRIRMVRTAGQHDTFPARALQIFNDLLAFSSNIRFIFVVFLVTGFYSFGGFRFRHAEIGKSDSKLFCQCIIIIQWQERIEVLDSLILNVLQVISNDLRIGRNDRAVKVVSGIRILMFLIRNIRIENGLDAFLDQALYMAMYQLCRIADAL